MDPSSEAYIFLFHTFNPVVRKSFNTQKFKDHMFTVYWINNVYYYKGKGTSFARTISINRFGVHCTTQRSRFFLVPIQRPFERTT